MQHIRAKGKRTLRRRNPPQRVYLQHHAALSQRLRRCWWVWFYRLLQPSWCRIGCFDMFGKTVSSSTSTYEWNKNSFCTGYIDLYSIYHARAHAQISLAEPDPFPQRRSLSACGDLTQNFPRAKEPLLGTPDVPFCSACKVLQSVAMAEKKDAETNLIGEFVMQLFKLVLYIAVNYDLKIYWDFNSHTTDVMLHSTNRVTLCNTSWHTLVS